MSDYQDAKGAAAIVSRILEAHKTLVGIAYDLRRMDDFDHAQDMSDAALRCRAAYNELRKGVEPI